MLPCHLNLVNMAERRRGLEAPKVSLPITLAAFATVGIATTYFLGGKLLDVIEAEDTPAVDVAPATTRDAHMCAHQAWTQHSLDFPDGEVPAEFTSLHTENKVWTTFDFGEDSDLGRQFGSFTPLDEDKILISLVMESPGLGKGGVTLMCTNIEGPGIACDLASLNNDPSLSN